MAPNVTLKEPTSYVLSLNRSEGCPRMGYFILGRDGRGALPRLSPYIICCVPTYRAESSI